MQDNNQLRNATYFTDNQEYILLSFISMFNYQLICQPDFQSIIFE